MFASKSLSIHLLRGIGGFAAFGLAIATIQFIWPVLILIPLGFFLLRGCPMCWTMGLIETVRNSLRKGSDASSAPLCYECSIDTRSKSRQEIV
ncbi:MAG: hypothetical protein H0U76_14765 [Ktedonobacteraceae bacterium]|nr:hypothetical protein [Ktedonobacteraceae bacterium]